MPQLTDRFGPIQQQVVLNGSGNGQVTFQPNGSNARITNLFVKVAPISPATTPTNQAQCFMYKGQVADSTLIQNTNSGSTGAAAQGSIDLMDGETLYVVWTGGDPGATASATFIGNVIPFDQIGSANITWEDPIAAGDGSLVYPQIKSPNFVTNVSGWILRRDGSVEFGSAVIRGTVIAGGGTVMLDSNGVEVIGNTYTYIINRTTGFIAKFTSDTGAFGELFPAVLILQSNNPTTVNGNAVSAGEVLVDTDHVGAVDTPRLTVFSPAVTGHSISSLSLYGEASNGIVQPHIGISGYLQSGFTDEIGHQYFRGENRRFTISFTNLNSFNFPVTFTTPFSQAPIVHCNISYGAGASSRWGTRALNISTTGFTMNFAYMADSTTLSTWTNGPVEYSAYEVTP